MDSDSYSAKNMDEKRLFNVAANHQRMMHILNGGSSDSPLPLLEEKVVEEKIDVPFEKVLTKLNDTSNVLPVNYQDIREQISHIIHLRENEIHYVVEYLNESMYGLPPLILHGPLGSGKTTICTAALSRLRTPWVSIVCNEYSNCKSFIQALWFSIVSKLRRATEPASSSGNVPKTVSEFVDMLHEMISHLVKPNTLEVRLHILLDGVDLLSSLEMGLGHRLLTLFEICHPSIKVIGIACSVHGTVFPSCLICPLAPLTDQQIVKVLVHKATTCPELLLSSYYLEETSSGGLIFGHDSSQSDTKDRESSNIIAVFRNMMTTILPRLVVATKHIAELWTLAQVIWSQYVAYWNSAAYQLSLGKQRSLSVSGTTSSSSSTSVAGDTKLDIHLVEDIVKIILKSPSIYISEYDNIADQIAQYKPDRKKRRTTGTAALNTTVQDTWRRSYKSVLNMETMRHTDWLTDMPISLKYLMMAAYIASQNPQEKDAELFNATRGKRSRPRKSLDRGDELETTSTSDSTVASIAFDSERLIGLFFQICCEGKALLISEMRVTPASARPGGLNMYNDREENKQLIRELKMSYGDTFLFASIATLVKQRIILSSSDSNAVLDITTSTRPLTYISTIDSTMANELGAALNFPIEKYVQRS